MTVPSNELNKWLKRSIAFSSDILLTIISLFASIWLSSIILDNINLYSILLMLFIQCSFYVTCGLYRGIWRFASIPDLIRILRAVVFGTVVNVLFLKLVSYNIPVKTYIIYLLLLPTLLSSTRLLYRWYKDYPHYFLQGKRVLIVGAGSAGEGLIRDIYRSSFINKYCPIAFVDDNPMLKGAEIQGVRVLGSCEDIPKLTQLHHIEMIIIAIPTASAKRMREIVSYCETSHVPFRTLPGLKNITDGIVKISSLREILLDDLLGREQIYHDLESIELFIKEKVVLVTGAGGSIGSELCRQICQLAPANLIIVDHSEFNLYSIDMELQKTNIPIKIHPYLCNITDKIGIESIFDKFKPDLVFHVAAYKHVPLLEENIRVAMYNNIIGTKILAESAEKFATKTFVLISTDKAVNPTSIMGATKRAAEIFCQNYNLHSATHFLTVRFGNVLDSAGSVIPLFRQQLQNGGPITVTHPHISRYFMTIPEAAQLILQASTMTGQGEIFVLDMGEPINIRYLAEQMIKLSGRMVGQDIEIKYTGLRAGEKLYEELFHEHEQIQKTSHPKLRQAKVRLYDWIQLTRILAQIDEACHANDERLLLKLLYELVPEFAEATHANTPLTETIKNDYQEAPLAVN